MGAMMRQPRGSVRADALRSSLLLIAVCQLILFFTPRAQACADCKLQGSWWCFDNPAIPSGYQMCQTIDASDLCLLLGSCPTGGGGNPPTAKTLMVLEEFWSTNSPVTLTTIQSVKAASVHDVRAAIARATGLDVDSLRLRGAGFTYALGDIEGSKGQAFMVGDSGFLLRAVEDKSGVALTTCGFTSGSSLSRIGTDIVRAGDLTIVPLPSNGEKLFVSIRIETHKREEIAPQLESIQKEYRGELASIMDADRLKITIGTAPADCGP
jgi:hypothetical protein